MIRKTFSPSSHNIAKLFLLTLFIGSLGLLAVYNASVVEGFDSFNDKYHFVKQQAMWLALGLVLFIILSKLPLEFIKRLIPLCFGLSLLFMLLVIIPGVGTKLQGARRWIYFGFFNLQPSEFFKLSLILYLAYWLEKPRQMKAFITLLTLSTLLIMLQPDLGTAVVLGASSFIIYYLSGAPVKELFVVFLTALLLGSITIIASPYRLQRVHTFLDPTSDPLGTSYHINQVILGLGSGGVFGVGLGRSIQKHSYLPEATTDSIFAVIGEEMGFIGGVILILLMMSLILYCFRLSRNVNNNFAKIVIAGISCLFSVQTFVNLAAMVALVPLTGVPLPLISYGGSSLIATFAGLGILASAAREK